MPFPLPRRPRAFALVAASVLALAAPGAALADTIRVDGDGVAPVDSEPLDFGTVCLGDTVMDSALIAVNATGHPGSGNSTYDNGATVSVDVTSTSGNGLSAADPADTIRLPMNWTSLSNGTRSDAVSSMITFTPSSTGSFSGSVLYAASGARSTGGTLVRTGTLQVVAEVIDCAPGAAPTPAPTASPTRRPVATATATTAASASPSPSPAGTTATATPKAAATPPSTATGRSGGSGNVQTALLVVGLLTLAVSLVAFRPRPRTG